MKLGTSTLGCPEWTLEEILTRVPSYGYNGVELRGLGPDLDLTRSPHFSTPAAVECSRRAFADAGLEICGVDSSARFTDADPSERARNADHARATLDLAAALGAPFVRVFGGGLPEGVAQVTAVGWVAESLRALGEYAARNPGGPIFVLETHDAFSTGRQVAEVLAQVNHPSVAALWDLHHPYRQGESPEETSAALAPYTKATHVKDSRPDGTYCLLGEGDVPVQDMLRLLHRSGYRGYVNLEWEKRWIPTLLAPEVAFPQYAQTLRHYLAGLPDP